MNNIIVWLICHGSCEISEVDHIYA